MTKIVASVNIGNNAVTVWIAKFSASCRACLYSSAAEHWSRKPGVRSSILLGGCSPFFFFSLPFYIFLLPNYLFLIPWIYIYFFFAQLKKKHFEEVCIPPPKAKQRQLYSRPFAIKEAASFIFWHSASLPIFCTQLHWMHTPTLAFLKWIHAGSWWSIN